MKHCQTLFAAVLSAFALLPSRAEEPKLSAPATPTPAPATPAPATPAPAHAEAALSALPVPGRAGARPNSRFEALPEAEKEHVRKMAEHRKARDAAERELLRLGEEADKRKEEILAENEEAKKLRDRIDELKAEFAAATNALETIYREDEKIAGLVAKIGPLQKTVESSQKSLNQEVATAMQLRMAAQRAAWEKAHPAPKPPEGADEESAGKQAAPTAGEKTAPANE